MKRKSPQPLFLGIKVNTKLSPFPFLLTRGNEVIGQLNSLKNAHGLLLWVSFLDLLSAEIGSELHKMYGIPENRNHRGFRGKRKQQSH